MTEKEVKQTKAVADIIIGKFRTLAALENKVLEARAALSRLLETHNSAAQPGTQENLTVKHQDMLTTLESRLKTQVAEMETIIDELQLTTPYLRAYVLPQISEVVGTLKARDAAEQEELTQLVAALVDTDNPQSLEQLEAIIITRLRDNLEKTFGI